MNGCRLTSLRRALHQQPKEGRKNIREVCMNGVDLFGLLMIGIVVLLWLWGAVDTWSKQRDTLRKVPSSAWERAA